MAINTRTQGANARQYGWDERQQEREQRAGNWLPLDDLGDDVFEGTPQLRAMRQPRPTTQHSQPIPQTRPQPTRQEKAASQPQTAQGVPARWLAMAAGVALTALALYVVLSAALDWTQTKLDDMQYGRPRTQQTDAYVGHGESNGVPSHFIAMNLNRRVTIIELPGGDPTKPNTIVGPYLFGQGEDLTPVQLDVRDVNADGKEDLVVSVKSEQLIYLNDGSGFKLMTPEERAALEKTLSKPAAGTGATNAQGSGK